ncbi:MAG: pilus assembly protein PilM [Myxococcota bacterium]
MFNRLVTGLDIGSYAVKLVEIQAGVRGVEFVRFEQARLPHRENREEHEAAIRSFLAEREISHEFVVTALPSARVTQRHLRFPFTGARRVAQAIPYELEEELPFPLTQMVLTHGQVLARPDRTDVLVVMSPRDEVASWLDELRRLEIEPRILEIEGAVLANLCSHLMVADAGRLLLDIGHRKTNLCLLVDGKPVVIRSIPIAGHAFNEALAKDLGLAYESAEERKHEQGIFEAGTSRPICATVGNLLEELTRETWRSIQSVIADPLDAIAPVELLLMGGSAALEGLPGYFEEQTRLPTSILDVKEARAGLEGLAEAGTARFAQAAALALRGSTSERVTELDLRQGEFEYVPDLSGLRTQLRLAVGLFALCLLLWPASLYSGVLARTSRAETLHRSLESACLAVAPDAHCSEDPYAALEERLRTTREIASHLGVTGRGLSMLELVREISERIPPNLDVSLSELKIERHNLQLRGHATDLRSVGSMTKALREYEPFANVPDPSTVQDPRRGGVTFSLTIKLKDPT